MDLAALKADETSRWNAAVVLPHWAPLADSVAKRLEACKARYDTVSRETGVPWYLIAVIHERECSQSWKGSLAQGDPWNRVSIHVPRGRGPFTSWEEAAVDALTACAPFTARNTDWSIGGALVALEAYNGFGYASRGIPSPYIWSGTDQYKRGKYVSDGHFDPNAIDGQLGCAALLKSIIKLEEG